MITTKQFHAINDINKKAQTALQAAEERLARAQRDFEIAKAFAIQTETLFQATYEEITAAEFAAK